MKEKHKNILKDLGDEEKTLNIEFLWCHDDKLGRICKLSHTIFQESLESLTRKDFQLNATIIECVWIELEECEVMFIVG